METKVKVERAKKLISQAMKEVLELEKDKHISKATWFSLYEALGSLDFDFGLTERE